MIVIVGGGVVTAGVGYIMKAERNIGSWFSVSGHHTDLRLFCLKTVYSWQKHLLQKMTLLHPKPFFIFATLDSDWSQCIGHQQSRSAKDCRHSVPQYWSTLLFAPTFWSYRHKNPFFRRSWFWMIIADVSSVGAFSAVAFLVKCLGFQWTLERDQGSLAPGDDIHVGPSDLQNFGAILDSSYHVECSQILALTSHT